MFKRFLIPLGIVILITLTINQLNKSGNNKEDTLTVYSSRQAHLIQPLLDEFSKETGIKTQLLTANAAPLIERIKTEGGNCPADILITVDAGNLWYANQENLFTPINSNTINKNIPAHLRAADNNWIGLSIRARTIVYNTNAITPDELSSYEDLADPKWKGNLLLRTSKKVYNQSLVAMLIAVHGEAETLNTVKGWVNNLAAPPFASDTDVLKAVAAGQGSIGIVNTYYFGRLIEKNPDLPIKLFFPNQSNTGTHINVSGAGILKYSPNKKAAKKFLEWASEEKAQRILADSNKEYPANPSINASEEVLSWGEFTASTLNVSQAGQLQGRAIQLMNNANYH